MNVKLLKNVIENGGVKVSRHHGREIPYVAGAIVEMSDTSAAKYIEKGLAEECQVQADAEDRA
jgi:hypothetical protein